MTQPIILDCKNLWKIYGPNARRIFTEANGRPTPDMLDRAGVVTAVRGVDVQIRQGEIFVIMGLSGSGKSTLVRCLSRLVEPTGGQILFEGRDLSAATETELIDIRRKKMGMVFQHFPLLPHLTVLQNTAFPLEIQGIDRTTREARAREVIDLVGLAGREGNYPSELSGGQQQRVGIARSLVVEPDLWFLDEPFSALDPLIRREMQDEFLRLQNLLHKTIVFITHDFDEAIRLADRIAVMKDGAIVQVATPEHLVLNPASAYVEEFTRHIPRAKVLTIAAVMTAPKDSASDNFAGDLPGTVLIEDVAAAITASDRPHRVCDDAGRMIGQIDATTVIDLLVNRAPS